MVKQQRTFAVIGLGNFGGTVARELIRFGNDVVGIDRDKAAVTRLAEDLTEAIIGDARDEAALKEAGLSDVDCALVSIGHDLESSVLATMNCKLLGIDTIWAKATSATHHRILSRLGADRVIHPEEEVGRQIAQVLHNPLVRDYVPLGNGYYVVNFMVPESLQSTEVRKLDLGSFDIRCLGVMRGQKYLGHDDGATSLKPDDKLLLLGKRQDLRTFADTL